VIPTPQELFGMGISTKVSFSHSHPKIAAISHKDLIFIRVNIYPRAKRKIFLQVHFKLSAV
jgi:hypothetical protein